MVVVAMALQVARSRADERWSSVIRHWDEEAIPGIAPPLLYPTGVAITIDISKTAPSGGNIFQAWRQHRWEGFTCILVLRQERSFFGSRTEAHMTGGEPRLVDAVRNVFAAVEVELEIVVPGPGDAAKPAAPKSGRDLERAAFEEKIKHFLRDKQSARRKR